MNWYYLEKEFYDYADDVEGVSIHYVWTPLGGIADWENQRATRFMPRVHPPASGVTSLAPTRLRKKILKLPQRIPDPESGNLTDRYLLSHYFEVFQDGYRYYSPLYTEEIVTGVGAQSSAHEAAGEAGPSPSLTVAPIDAKESEP